MKKSAKIILTILSGGVALVVGAAVYTIRQSWPQHNGTVQLSDLRDEVTVHRDEFGIPHIYASNTHDLFLAQGFVHAQDRFWQMDFRRHLGSGRLAELLGQSAASQDQFLRTLGWARVAEQELESLADEDTAVLEAYAQGVNSYLNQRSEHQLSLEHTVIEVQNPDYQPADWQPLHTLTWPKVMAWDLGKLNLELEIERSHLLQSFSREQIATLFPPYPDDHPVILPGGRADTSEDASQSSVRPLPSEEVLRHPSVQRSLQAVRQQLTTVAPLFPASRGLGSNSWVIAGDRTATGKPLLANDPHLGVQMPSLWYEVGLHCTPQGPDCPYDVTGVSFAGMPGVIIGHTDRTAWGLTHLSADVLDLYIEKINPDNPNQYEVQGEWVDMTQVEETIRVAGAEPIQQTIRYTRHGPIISDTYEPLNQFGQQAGIELPEEYAIALRWTALEPSTLMSSVLEFNRADTWSEFQQAAQTFDIVPHNLVYADVEGNIGLQVPGHIPIRAQGDGRYPQPGWTADSDWTGYIPFNRLPAELNPPQGYIATANNPVTDAYPYLITKDWSYGFRARRIQQLINQQTEPFTLADMQRIQGDNYHLFAETLVPQLLQLPVSEARLQAAQQILQDWDYQNQRQAAAPTIFAAIWRQLLAHTFHDQLPQTHWPDGSDRWMEVMRQQLQQPNSFWWDDQETAQPESRDDILQQSWIQAMNQLEQQLGTDPQAWRWDDLHTVKLEHQTLGQSGIAPLEALFNRGPVGVSGGNGVVNATAWDTAQSFSITAIPSARMIIDMSHLNNSQSVHATGQSGHPFHPHYVDQLPLWQQLDYHPMNGQQPIEQMQTQAEATLILSP